MTFVLLISEAGMNIYGLVDCDKLCFVINEMYGCYYEIILLNQNRFYNIFKVLMITRYKRKI